MSDFYAMYLFLFIGIILMGIGFWVRYNWLFWLSALSWVFVGAYCLTMPAINTFVRYFGLFSGIVALVMFFMPVIIKPRDKVADFSMYDDPKKMTNWFDEDINEIRETRKSIDDARRGSR